MIPCNANAPWRDESEMLTHWIGLSDGPSKTRALGQWFRLAHRDKGWREYMGVTRPPACIESLLYRAKVDRAMGGHV